MREARALAAARREGTAADLAGHDVLRHRPRRARRARAAAARAERRRRPRVDPAALPLSRRRSPTTCSTRWPSARRSAATSTCRCSTRRPTCCKRMRRPGDRADLRQAARAHPRARARTSRCARRSSSVSPARPTRSSTSSSGFVARHRVRSRRRLHLLARGRHARVRDGRRRAGGGEAAAPQRADGAAEADRRARAEGAGSDGRSRVLVDGPSPEHELVLQGRLEGQAPDIDPVVYPRPTATRPTFAPGDLVQRADRRRHAATTWLRGDRVARLDVRAIFMGGIFAGNTRSGPVPTFCF